MRKPPSIDMQSWADQIATAIGLISKRYVEISGSVTIQESGMEQAISFAIADHLSRYFLDRGYYFTVESSFRALEYYSIGHENTPFLRAATKEGGPLNGRVDVAAFLGNALSGFIEVKRWQDKSILIKELDRVIAIKDAIYKSALGYKVWCALAVPYFDWKNKKGISSHTDIADATKTLKEWIDEYLNSKEISLRYPSSKDWITYSSVMKEIKIPNADFIAADGKTHQVAHTGGIAVLIS